MTPKEIRPQSISLGECEGGNPKKKEIGPTIQSWLREGRRRKRAQGEASEGEGETEKMQEDGEGPRRGAESAQSRDCIS